MSVRADDLTSTVEYSADKWFMDRVPWALWICAAGLAIALNGGGRNGSGMGHAFVYLALLALALGGYFVTEKLEQSSVPFFITVPVFIVVALVVMFIIDAVAGASTSRTGSGTGSSGFWVRMVNPPLHVGGWLMAYLGVGWTAFCVYRHLYPGRSPIELSTGGIALREVWLDEVVIPWSEVQDTSRPDAGGLLGNPHMACVQVSREFYDRSIAPRISMLAPPDVGGMFKPDAANAVVVLTSSERAAELGCIRDAVTARCRAFRDGEAPETRAKAGSSGARSDRIVLGLWSLDGSRRQMAAFGAPLLALAAVAMHALLWGR